MNYIQTFVLFTFFVCLCLQLQLTQNQRSLLDISRQINILTRHNTQANYLSEISIYKMFDTQINHLNGNQTQVYEISKQTIFIQSSVGVPTKDGQFYPLFVFSNDVYYSIKGQILIDMTHKRHLHYSAKNQNLIIAQIKSKSQITIFRLTFSYKKLNIPQEATLKVPTNVRAQDYLVFKTVTITGSKYYIFINQKFKEIHFYTKEGILDQNKTIKLPNQQTGKIDNSKIVPSKIQAIKLNTHLIILDNSHLYSLFLNGKGQNVKLCESIYDKIYGIKFDQTDFRSFYAITFNHIYKFDTVTGRIMKKTILLQPLCDQSFNMFCTIDFHILKQHIFVEGNRMNYYVNGTSNEYQSMRLPFSFQNCQDGNQGKLFFIKKSPQTYISTYACQGKQKVYLSSLSIQFEEQYVQGIDFTKLRIPLVIFSLGLIFYFSVRRSKKQKGKAEQEQELVDRKLEKQILDRMYHQREQRKSRDTKISEVRQDEINIASTGKKRRLTKQD